MVFYDFLDFICYGLGLYYVIRVVIWAIYEIYPHVTSQYDLKQRYGDKTWAVVTGASDGIGLGYCQEFARQGFNIVMIARTEAKLEKAAFDLAQQHNVQTKAIVADFSECTANPPEFFGRITSQLENLPISILVNNVGWATSPRRFVNNTTDEILNVNALNLWPIIYLSHFVVNQMLSQNRRGAIINLSSVAGMIPFPSVAVYSAGKAFDDFFSRAQFEQYGDQIDFLSVRPSYVSTPLTNHMKLSFNVCMPDTCVNASLKHLGKSPYTCGFWVHCIVGFLFQNLPTSIAFGLAKKRTDATKKKDN